MKNTKFLVKLIRGTRAVEYVERIDRSPVQTTLKRNLALAMGKWAAEDLVDSLGNSPGTGCMDERRAYKSQTLRVNSSCSRVVGNPSPTGLCKFPVIRPE